MDRVVVVKRIAGEQGGVVTREQALSAGFSRHEIDNLLTSGRWRRLARATYAIGATGEATRVERRRRIRAAVLSLGPEAHAVLATAAELHAIAGLARTATIHVGLPGRMARPTRVRDAAVVVHQFERVAGALTSVDGIPVTVPTHTLADLVLRERRYAAVALLDSALNRMVISEDDLGAIPALLVRRRGAVHARRCLAEANGAAQSPLETRTRLRCVDGGVPPDALQVEVRDADGYLLGVGDMGWRAGRVIAEADGRDPHSAPGALFEDRRRQNRLTNAGWTVLRFTWSDTLRPDYVPHVVRQALATRTTRRS
ncbi:type IV toxin-antitoxin system AbiEi family antitoxin domain-containing protein [Micromonospora robiginosa]|uniref:Type IV toxin-antitoxin system AbiEi family antitoxin domain-containing protein n=1 Tax=Micromonospora robiginosa TaxID=2749844 RepID=A0A7L6BE92_9ACTN|nr:type IV toxin-antitoxin system AbiEi family antitoxin domain-containing protein [Micromonospora ferruginea]QLQ40256.2 type IV toxin-antitoxin system AbiEi family antitoxin domain-containing protein [Micromonospora ferruginea]